MVNSTLSVKPTMNFVKEVKYLCENRADERLKGRQLQMLLFL